MDQPTENKDKKHRRLVCSQTIRLKTGRVLNAKDYGKKAFCFYVDN